MDLQKLEIDALHARQVAIEKTGAIPDGGTANLDAAVFHLQKGQRSAPLIEALKRAGLNAYESRWNGRCVFVSPPVRGQGDRNAVSNQHFIDALRQRGWKVAGYYQMD